MRKVLCIAAHADDEVLGCGGTMARHSWDGDHVSVLLLCPERKQQSAQAAHIIDVGLSVLGYADQKFDTYPLFEIIQGIEAIVRAAKPDIVYTHWIGDLNKDHEITARAVLTACRPLPDFSVTELYGFEIPSSTEWGMNGFVPDHFVELSEEQSSKRYRALQCFGDQIKKRPHARSFASMISRELGRGHQVGVAAAESFHTYRKIRRI